MATFAFRFSAFCSNFNFSGVLVAIILVAFSRGFLFSFLGFALEKPLNSAGLLNILLWFTEFDEAEGVAGISLLDPASVLSSAECVLAEIPGTEVGLLDGPASLHS